MNTGKFLKRLLKIIFYCIGAIISVIIIALFLFWMELKRDVTLPDPTGIYSVGRTAYHWIDSSRTDSLSPKPYNKRELIIWIWYPVSNIKSDSVVDYDRAEWGKEINEQSDFFINNFFSRDGAKMHPHSFRNAEISNKQQRYPVILMKSGIGMMAINYTTIAEDLASHGYIVVGTDSPYSTYMVVFPDGRVVKKTAEGNPGEAEISSGYRDMLLNRLTGIWTDDTRFVINELEKLKSQDSSGGFWNHFDMQSTGIFGHSFGGAVSAQFCLEDPRCKAGIDIDGAPHGNVIQKGLSKPFMFLLADHSDELDTVSLHIKSNIEKIYKSFPDEHIWISLTGARHFNFSDMPFQKEILISRLFGATGSIGGKHGLEVVSACLRTFFDIYLKNISSAKIQDIPGRYPEVKFEK